MAFYSAPCQAHWRMDVANDIQLLRRTGPFQLALLSRLRRDDKILPAMKAVWLHSLSSSCPTEESVEHDLQRVHWRPVAESLLNQVLSCGTQHQDCEPMTSQLHACDRRSLLMPGSVAVMQIMLPQLQRKDRLPEKDFTEVLLDETIRLSAVLRRCLPGALWQALKAAGNPEAFGAANDVISLLGHDVIIEMTSRACASLHEGEGLGQATFESVRGHLEVLIQALICNLAAQATDVGDSDEQESPSGEDPHVLRALLPAVAAVLLLPVSQQVAALEKQFPTARSWVEYLEPLLHPFPVDRTWNTFFEHGIRAALHLHASDLEESLCLSAALGDDVQDACSWA